MLGRVVVLSGLSLYCASTISSPSSSPFVSSSPQPLLLSHGPVRSMGLNTKDFVNKNENKEHKKKSGSTEPLLPNRNLNKDSQIPPKENPQDINITNFTNNYKQQPPPPPESPKETFFLTKNETDTPPLSASSTTTTKEETERKSEPPSSHSSSSSPPPPTQLSKPPFFTTETLAVLLGLPFLFILVPGTIHGLAWLEFQIWKNLDISLIIMTPAFSYLVASAYLIRRNLRKENRW